jgi:eukaryotic-like serine/threonine-protein kinase
VGPTPPLVDGGKPLFPETRMIETDPLIEQALRDFEVTKENLKRLEDLLEAVKKAMSAREGRLYAERCREFRSILKGLPQIDGWLPEDRLLDGQMPLKPDGRISLQAQELTEYRSKVGTTRLKLVRDTVRQLIFETDEALRDVGVHCEEKPDNDHVPATLWQPIKDRILQIETLLGRRIQDAGDLGRHLSFGMVGDYNDIVKRDWPTVKARLVPSLYGSDEPLPVNVADLADPLSAQRTKSVGADRKNAIRRAVMSDGLITRFGQVLNLRGIGEGANGLVYAGFLLNHSVAVKLLSDPSREKLARFRAEYLHVRTLPAHPGIVRLLHYEELDTPAGMVPAIVMARYDGALKGRKADTFQELTAFCEFLLNVLEFLHQNGVIHRDLKPENVLVAKDGWALTDFGIASYNPDMFGTQEFVTRKGDILGNRGFSAPEQALGAAAHVTMDIYALGQLCQWYALGSTHHGTRRQSITTRFPEAGAIDSIVNRCLAHAPGERFQSIPELRSDLEILSSERRLQDPWECLDRFRAVLGETFPRNSQGIASSSDANVIGRFFTALSRRNKPAIAFWFDGRSTNHAEDLAHLGEGLWLVDGMEIEPVKLWVHMHPSEHQDFALLLLNPRPSFGLSASPGQYEEVALVDDTTYVTRAEYDNGFAEIGGQVVSLRGHRVDVRTRHTVRRAIFIASVYHDAARPENDRRTMRIVEDAVTGNLRDHQLVSFANEIGEHMHRALTDGL